MQVILLQRVAKLGQMGEVVNVKDGYRLSRTGVVYVTPVALRARCVEVILAPALCSFDADGGHALLHQSANHGGADLQQDGEFFLLHCVNLN